MAEAGRSVLVLSCDFRRPRVHRLFDVVDGIGLTDVLSNPGLELADVVVDTNVRGVRLVRSGSFVANPAELIGAGHDFLAEARLMADVVLIDTAPLLVANDASEVMPKVDTVVVVARSGKTSRGAAQRASDLLERVGAKVLGVVLTAAPEAPTNHRYYYYRYYIRQDGPLGWRRALRRVRPSPTPELLRVPPRSSLPAEQAEVSTPPATAPSAKHKPRGPVDTDDGAEPGERGAAPESDPVPVAAIASEAGTRTPPPWPVTPRSRESILRSLWKELGGGR
jgi:capsular exopolysaccharide synthesis family protein